MIGLSSLLVLQARRSVSRGAGARGGDRAAEEDARADGEAGQGRGVQALRDGARVPPKEAGVMNNLVGFVNFRKFSSLNLPHGIDVSQSK